MELGVEKKQQSYTPKVEIVGVSKHRKFRKTNTFSLRKSLDTPCLKVFKMLEGGKSDAGRVVHMIQCIYVFK